MGQVRIVKETDTEGKETGNVQVIITFDPAAHIANYDSNPGEAIGPDGKVVFRDTLPRRFLMAAMEALGHAFTVCVTPDEELDAEVAVKKSVRPDVHPAIWGLSATELTPEMAQTVFGVAGPPSGVRIKIKEAGQ